MAERLNDLYQEPLEVLTFGESCVYRVVHRLAEAFDYLHVAMGVGGCIRNDFLEQVHFHEAGAAEGCEHAAFGEEFHREQVNVLVATGAFLQVVLAFDEFWRVEHDEVESFGFVAAFAQVLEYVGFDMGGVRSAELVAHDSVFCQFEGVLGNVDLIDFFAAGR